MLQRTRTGLLTAAAVLGFVGVAYAGPEWDAEHPWWCNPMAEACGKWSSATQYVGPTYTDCLDITQGWKSEEYVQTRCNN